MIMGCHGYGMMERSDVCCCVDTAHVLSWQYKDILGSLLSAHSSQLSWEVVRIRGLQRG